MTREFTRIAVGAAKLRLWHARRGYHRETNRLRREAKAIRALALAADDERREALRARDVQSKAFHARLGFIGRFAAERDAIRDAAAAEYTRLSRRHVRMRENLKGKIALLRREVAVQERIAAKLSRRLEARGDFEP